MSKWRYSFNDFGPKYRLIQDNINFTLLRPSTKIGFFPKVIGINKDQLFPNLYSQRVKKSFKPVENMKVTGKNLTSFKPPWRTSSSKVPLESEAIIF